MISPTINGYTTIKDHTKSIIWNHYIRNTNIKCAMCQTKVYGKVYGLSMCQTKWKTWCGVFVKTLCQQKQA